MQNSRDRQRSRLSAALVRHSATAVALAALQLGLGAQTVTISDGQFAGADWATLQVFSGGNGGWASATMVSTEGNPDAYRRVEHHINAAPSGSSVSSIGVVHLLTAQPVDPASVGSVVRISARVDAKRFSSNAQGQGLTFFLRQNGVLYRNSTYFTSPLTSWETHAVVDLLPSDFVEYQGASLPDLSVCGAPFVVGFGTSNSTGFGGGAYSTAVGYDNFRFDLTVSPSASAYCTSGSSSNGCAAQISASGVASASAATGFTVTVSSVDGQRQGLLFYGVSGPTASPWGAQSFLCVKAPTQRTAPHNSGGTSGACDGALALDWNAWRAAHPSALGQPFAAGDSIWLQGWFRDPASSKTTALSNALEARLCP